jgi:hypothetical protein
MDAIISDLQFFQFSNAKKKRKREYFNLKFQNCDILFQMF